MRAMKPDCLDEGEEDALRLQNIHLFYCGKSQVPVPNFNLYLLKFCENSAELLSTFVDTVSKTLTGTPLVPLGSRGKITENCSGCTV